MGNLLSTVLGFVVRLGLLLGGLVFFASLLMAALLVLLVWLLRALWATLTGRPISPWTFQINWQAAWERYAAKFPFAVDFQAELARSNLYALTPRWARLVDNAQGFGHKDELEFPAA